MPLDPVDTRPLCAIYVAWHPSFAEGERTAARLYQHFRRDLFTNVAGGVGLSVLYRSASVAATGAPSPVPLDDSHVAVVFLLVSAAVGTNPGWRAYVTDMIAGAEARGLTARVIPVFMDGHARDVVGNVNAVRFYEWSESAELKEV
ncbi:MAG TPA: hypothetical protein VIW73_02560, partial [Candidatus Cybelea sp.]